MSPLRQLRVALASLARNKVRAALSASGIVAGVGALVAMLAVAEGAKRETLAQIEQLGTGNLIVRPVELTAVQAARARAARSRGLTADDLELLRRAVPGVREAAPLAEVPAAVVDAETGRPPEVVATTAEYFSAKGLSAARGRLLCDDDVARRSLVCVLGAEVARALGASGRVGERLRIEDALFEVVGVLVERGLREGRAPIAARDVDRTVFLPLGAQAALAAPALGAPLHALSEVSLRLADPGAVLAGAAVARRAMQLAHGGVEDYQLVVPTELIAQAHRAQRTFNLVLASVAALSLLVGGTGIMNVLLASVSERTREIGVRRAVGASRAHVLSHFLAESLVLTLLGGAAGVALGVAGAGTIAALAGWTTAVTPWAVALSLAMAALVGLASGLWPAMRAARLDPIEALRHP